jgi:hypothetical protein
MLTGYRKGTESVLSMMRSRTPVHSDALAANVGPTGDRLDRPLAVSCPSRAAKDKLWRADGSVACVTKSARRDTRHNRDWSGAPLREREVHARRLQATREDIVRP